MKNFDLQNAITADNKKLVVAASAREHMTTRSPVHGSSVSVVAGSSVLGQLPLGQTDILPG
jgi:hypothetical protein